MYYVGPLSARQRNAILMAFRYRADIGPLLTIFRSSFPPRKKEKKQNIDNVGPPLTKLFGSAHGYLKIYCKTNVDSVASTMFQVYLKLCGQTWRAI